MRSILGIRSTVVCATVLLAVLDGLPASAAACTEVTMPAPSGPGNDIRYTFDQAYACGQFANGDWWVVTDPTTRTVRITAIAPDTVTVPGGSRNGWESNPSDIVRQAFDYRVADFDAGLQPPLPHDAAAGTSIVKAVSVADGPGCRPCLQFAAVLTVLDAPPAVPTRTLRPPYFGPTKRQRTVDELCLDRLPRLPAGLLATTPPTFAQIDARFAPVQLDHKTNWTGDAMHPVDNLPNYGASIATDNAAGALRFTLDDFDANDPAHLAALVGYVQMGLDLAGMVEHGMAWPANGGHSNGRKLPVAFVAMLLDDPALVALAQRAVYSENQEVFFSPVANNDAGVVLFGMACSDAQYWQHIRYGNGNRVCRDPYGYIDGGSDEIGGAYQMCCTANPWRYTALAVRLLQSEAHFGYDPLLEYADRYTDLGIWALPDACAPYDGNPDNYGITYGPDGLGGCIPGAGRYPAVHGDLPGGFYSSVLGDEMWSTFRGCTPNCPGQTVRPQPPGVAVNRRVDLPVVPGRAVKDQFAANCAMAPWRLIADEVAAGALGAVVIDDGAPTPGLSYLWLYEHSDSSRTLVLRRVGSAIHFDPR